MAKYKARGVLRRSARTIESPVSDSPTAPLAYLRAQWPYKDYAVIVVLQDQEGTDHPDNAGKFFLHRVVK